MLGKDQGANAVDMGNRGYGNAPMDGRNDGKKIPDAGLVKLEGGTHFAYLEHLEQFLAVVIYFLTSEENT